MNVSARMAAGSRRMGWLLAGVMAVVLLMGLGPAQVRAETVPPHAESDYGSALPLGPGRYLRMMASDDAFSGSEPFTVGMRVRPDSLTGNQVLYHKPSDGTDKLDVRLQLEEGVPAAVLNGKVFHADRTLAALEWVHVAFSLDTVQKAAVWYIDGAESGRSSFTVDDFSHLGESYSPAYAGRAADGSDPYSGYIVELFVSGYSGMTGDHIAAIMADGASAGWELDMRSWFSFDHPGYLGGIYDMYGGEAYYSVNARPVAIPYAGSASAGLLEGRLEAADGDQDRLRYSLYDDYSTYGYDLMEQSLEYGYIRLQPDGAFRYEAYVPQQSGWEEFAFRAYDGVEYSAPVTGGINVCNPGFEEAELDGIMLDGAMLPFETCKFAYELEWDAGSAYTKELRLEAAGTVADLYVENEPAAGGMTYTLTPGYNHIRLQSSGNTDPLHTVNYDLFIYLKTPLDTYLDEVTRDMLGSNPDLLHVAAGLNLQPGLPAWPEGIHAVWSSATGAVDPEDGSVYRTPFHRWDMLMVSVTDQVYSLSRAMELKVMAFEPIPGGGGSAPYLPLKGGQFVYSGVEGNLDLRTLNPEFGSLTYSILPNTGPYYGTLESTVTGGVYRYEPMPEASFRGWDSFIFTGSDGAASGTAVVWIGRNLQQSGDTELDGFLVDGAPPAAGSVSGYDINIVVPYKDAVALTLPAGGTLRHWDGRLITETSLHLIDGNQSYMLRMEGPDGAAVYRLNIDRLAETELGGLAVNGTGVELWADLFDYSVEVPWNATEVMVEAAASPGMSITVSQSGTVIPLDPVIGAYPVILAEGSTTVNILVQSADAERSSTYHLEIIRQTEPPMGEPAGVTAIVYGGSVHTYDPASSYILLDALPEGSYTAELDFSFGNPNSRLVSAIMAGPSGSVTLSVYGDGRQLRIPVTPDGATVSLLVRDPYGYDKSTTVRISFGPVLKYTEVMHDGRSMKLTFSEKLGAFDPEFIELETGGVRARLSDLIVGGPSLSENMVKLRLNTPVSPGQAVSLEVRAGAAGGMGGRGARTGPGTLMNYSSDYDLDSRLDITDLLRMSDLGRSPGELQKVLAQISPRFVQ